MSNIEKIRQEIERLKTTNPSEYNYNNAEGYIWAMDDILAFINSLPEEKPSEDLEEAAEKYAYRGIPDEMKSYVKPVGDEVIKNFIAEAEWKANQLLKGSPLPEDTVLFQKGVAEGRRLEREDGGLAWQDIKSIVKIADDLLDDPKARVAFQNHNEEYYYKRVLDEYNKLHQAKGEKG